MNRIESAAIIGAGALGLLYAEQIKTCLGKNCFFLADGDRYNRIKDGKFVINGRSEQFSVESPGILQKDGAAKPDLLLVAVKNHHLADIVGLMEPAVTENAIIISVLNGIDSENILERHFPQAQVIRTVAVGMDAVKEGRKLDYTVSGKLLIGMKNNDRTNPHLLRLSAFLDSCKMAYEIPDDIERSLWWKWMINIGVNQASAVTGADYGVFHTDETARALMDAAMQETINVAKAAGVDLRDEDIPDWYPILHSLGAGNKTSMLQDIEAGRKTEVEAFSGKLIKISEELNIDVPVNRTLFQIIKTKELVYS